MICVVRRIYFINLFRKRNLFSWSALTQKILRPATDMFDDVSVVFELEGPGFTFARSKALVEDLFIKYPVEQ